MLKVTTLGEQDAVAAVAAIREELVRRGKTAVIAVSDGHGELITLLRMDGAPLPSVGVATRKCLTAAQERASTGEIGKNFRENGWQLANTDVRFTGWDGGVPVRHRGEVVGAVAVSGLDQAEDAELARLGVAAIAKLGRGGKKKAR
jgi:glc operon protein GlcG